MSTWLSALIATSLASVGLIVGWFVLGTQRVTEDVTKERRDAYGKLLAAMLDRASGRSASAAVDAERERPLSVEQLAVKAQFIASHELYTSQLLLSAASIADALDSEEGAAELTRLVTAMRLETQRNSSRSRRSPAWRHLYEERSMPVRVSSEKLPAGVQAQRARAISTRALTGLPRHRRRAERWSWY